MTRPSPEPGIRMFEPRRGALVAVAIFVLAALVLYLPVFSGQVIYGSDYYIAGWAWRHFGAEYFRQHHAIPLWNPYVFGGVPYVAGTAGDIFYPTAWLRWILPLPLATNLTFAGHLVLAGGAMYALLRGLRLSWSAAVTGGLAYQLTGIVASQVSPGHDGKLFAAALSPLLFLALLRAVRGKSTAAYGVVALLVGLALHGHPQSSYYLLVAGAIWTLFLVFAGADGPQGSARWRVLAFCAGAVALGFGLYAIQILPIFDYIQFSPRGAAGPSKGFEYATLYAMPPVETFTTFLPQLNGFNESYAGANFHKDHTEYLGALVLLLALCGLGSPGTHRRERRALGTIGVLFLLVAFGGHTPFYRAWYEIMPMMKSVRAEGMAFFLPALVVCVFAGFGAERLVSGRASLRRLGIGAGILGLFGLLGAMGGLDGIARTIAAPELLERAVQNTPALHADALRLLITVLVGGAVLFAIGASRLTGLGAAAALVVVVGADLWSVDRQFFSFGTPAQLYGGDAITATVKKTPLPFRVLDPKGRYGGLEVYPGSWLQGLDIPQLMGYHGQELNNFDELLGGKNEWVNQVNPAVLKLFAVRYVVLREAQSLPGYHKLMDSVISTPGKPGALFEADTIQPWVRLMAGAVKVPDTQSAEVVTDPRFPALDIAVYPDSVRLSPAELGGKVPPPPTASAAVTEWDAGSMRIGITGTDTRPLYLVVAENWFKDWQATIDGKPAPVLRAQHALLSVEVPPGARQVGFVFRSPAYERGRLITFASLIAIAGLLLIPRVRRGRPPDG